MLYLLLAILSSDSMTLALSFFRSRDGNRYGIILGNYLTCILLALLLTPGDGSVLSGSGSTVGMGAVAGFFYVSALVLMQTSVQQNGAGLTSAFARLGLVISLLVSVLFFEERPAVLQFLGVGLVLAALVLINNEGTGSAKKGFWLLLLTLLCSGGADAMSKVFEELGNPAENTRFFFWLFVTALLLTVCLALWERKRTGKRLVLREFAAGAAVGVPNYFSSYLLLRSLQKLPAFLVFPVFSTGTILLVLAAGLLFFRERLTKRQCLGVGLILAALVLLNL